MKSQIQQRPDAALSTRSKPKVPKLIDPTGRNFRKQYDHLLGLQKKVFDDGVSKPSDMVFSTHKEFAAALKRNTGFGGHFANEMATMIAEGDETLWPSQQVQQFELMQSPLRARYRDRMHAVLNVSGAGTGKTRVASIIPEAIRRMTERGVYDKATLVLVRRRAMVLPQSFTTNERASILLGNNEQPRKLKMEQRYVEQFLRMCSIYEPDKSVVTELLSLKSSNKNDVAQNIRSVLKAHNLLEKMSASPNFDALVRDLGYLIEQSAVVINSNDADDVELLRFSSSNPQFAEGGGDLLRALPEEYKNSRLVHVHTSLQDVRKADDEELPGAHTQLAIFARTMLHQQGSRRRIKDFLRNVGIIILDEAEGAHTHEHATMVEEAGGKVPDLFYASTTSDTQRRPGYDERLSYLAPTTAINRPERILKPQRLVRVETPRNVLYPSGSYEAADQLISQYASMLELPKNQHQPQPTDGHHLVIVDSRLLTYVSHMLRGHNAGTERQVRSYFTNKNEDLNAFLQQALNDPKAPPLCLVAGPDAVRGSFDWRALRSTWLGIHDNRKGDGNQQLLGRQFHTLLEPSYFVFQQFADQTHRNFLPHTVFPPDAKFPSEGSFDFVQGQTFLGKRMVAREKKAVQSAQQKTHTTAIVSSAVYQEKFDLQDGTFPPKLSDQRTLSAFSSIAYPRLSNDHTGVFDPKYLHSFAKTNGINVEVFMEYLGDVSQKCSDQKSALIELERAAHFARAAAARVPQQSYRVSH